MEYASLMAISPLDGRYHRKTAPLTQFFSEYALIRYRIQVEALYLIALHEAGLPGLEPIGEAGRNALHRLYREFSPDDARRVKEIEAVTNHDVKAVEYFIREKLESLDESWKQRLEWVHFGLTSQDINNTAIPLSLKEALHTQYLPLAAQLSEKLDGMAETWRQVPMLARTHGQPASPTTMGKELAVFVARLQAAYDELAALPAPAKFGGATGNFNAHYAAFPQADWEAFANRFVEESLGLKRSRPTTQIDHYDGLSRIFDAMRRLNTLLTDLCQDIWLYVSMEYFRQQSKAGEVGSSAMPHKVNPIDFENAEGNLGLSTALLEYLSRKLPVSRLQRDLTDSTLLRNVGVAVGHSYIALSAIMQGLGKLQLNEARIAADLNAHWEVLAEAIQTILRREQYHNPYEALKALTRGREGITQASLAEFIDNTDVSEAVKAELRALRPDTYTGNAALF